MIEPIPNLELSVRKAIETVLDPEYGLPITDLGLVQRLVIDHGTVQVALVLTTPSCPAGLVILEGVKRAVESLGGVDS